MATKYVTTILRLNITTKFVMYNYAFINIFKNVSKHILQRYMNNRFYNSLRLLAVGETLFIMIRKQHSEFDVLFQSQLAITKWIGWITWSSNLIVDMDVFQTI